MSMLHKIFTPTIAVLPPCFDRSVADARCKGTRSEGGFYLLRLPEAEFEI